MTMQTVKAQQKLPMVQASLGSFILGMISIFFNFLPSHKIQNKECHGSAAHMGNLSLIFYFVKAIDRAT